MKMSCKTSKPIFIIVNEQFFFYCFVESFIRLYVIYKLQSSSMNEKNVTGVLKIKI